MSKMIELRHVPDAVHRKLKARAAMKGMPLSDYLVSELTPIAELPTMDDFLDHLAHAWRVTLREPSAITIRKARESR